MTTVMFQIDDAAIARLKAEHPYLNPTGLCRVLLRQYSEHNVNLSEDEILRYLQWYEAQQRSGKSKHK